jgi:hypothetical protein
VKNFIQLAGAVLAAIVAALTLLSLLRNGYRRSLGSRRDASRRLSRLGTNAQLSFFTAVLGEPPAFSKRFESSDDDPTDQRLREYVYVQRYFYLHVVVTSDDGVVAFSLTTRSPRFKPKFRFGDRRNVSGMRVQLGSTRFSEVGSYPKRIRGLVRDSWCLYQEWYDLGEVAGNQQLILGINESGWSWAPSMARIVRAGQSLFDTKHSGYEPENRALEEFRRTARPNSYSVVRPDVCLFDDLLLHYLGPRRDYVRTLP